MSGTFEVPSDDIPRDPSGLIGEETDFVEQYFRPGLVSHETKAARRRERAGSGEIIRQPHACDVPTSDSLPLDTIWRCDCGRRYIKVGVDHWRRCIWPWPR